MRRQQDNQTVSFGIAGSNGNGQAPNAAQASLPFSPVLDRIPPQALDAEQAVLGCLLLDLTHESIDASRLHLRPEMFYREAHRRIFVAVCDLDDAGEPVDLLTVADHLEGSGGLEQVGGRPYLMACQAVVPALARCESYCERVKRAWTDRELIVYGGDAIGMAYDAETQPETKIAQLYTRIVDLGRQGGEEDLIHVAGIAADAFERITAASESESHLIGLSTGFREMDFLTGGLQPCDLIMLAGRPGSGKSLFSLALGEQVCDQGSSVAIFSLEMSRLQLTYRMIARDAGIDSMRLRAGYLRDGHRLASGEEGPDEWASLARAIARISDRPMFIDDTTDISVQQIRARARRKKVQQEQAGVPLGLVIVDYVQLVRPSGRHRDGNQNAELTEISHGLKSMARELEVPVVALSQLSRAVERQDGDKRPNPSHLLGSGGLDADADIIMMLYRPGMYEEMSERQLSRFYGPGGPGGEPLEVGIRKNRNGETGTVNLYVNLRLGRFSDPPASQTSQDMLQ